MSDTILETQRLILRQWRDSDLEAMFAINQDPQVMEHFPAPKTLEETRNFIAINRPLYDQVGYFIYAVELKNTHELIGFVGLQPVGIEMPFAPAVEILWRIGTKYWGKGYATEAAQAVEEHAFNNLGLDELVAFTTTTNTRSEKLMQRLGFMRCESEDFVHPKISEGHKLQRHVFYRKHKAMKIQPKIDMIAATIEDYPIIQNMARFYAYELSRYCGITEDIYNWAFPENGLYEGPDVSQYWKETDRHTFIIRIDGELGGFVLINKIGSSPEVDWNVGEFFIVAKFQGKGVGRQVAIKLFEQFQGTWDVMQMPSNKPAISFWKKVILDYTKDNYSESIKRIIEPEPHDMVVLSFSATK